MQRVINFSGGRSSAMMTIMEYKPGDIVLFTDTGREHPKTYKFINDFEAFENIPVTRISFHNANDAFKELLERKKYKVIPNRVKRICTVELKINTAKRYLKTLGILRFENLLGFRFDEQKRIAKGQSFFKKVHNKFPLNDAGITKAMVNDYFSKKEYNLEIPAILGNCTLCFLKGKNAIIAILKNYPDLAKPWIEDEEKANGRTYFKDVKIKTLLQIAQNNLFKDYDLDEIAPAFNCSCTNV